MKKHMMICLMLLASTNVLAFDTNQDQQTIDYQWLKALPKLCLTFDFYDASRIASFERPEPNNDALRHTGNRTIFRSPQTNMASVHSHKMSLSSKTPSLKSRLKRKLYQLLDKRFNVNLKRYTHIKANDYIRFEIEPRFSFRGRFKSVSLKAVLFE